MLRTTWRDVNLTPGEESVRLLTLKQKDGPTPRETNLDDPELTKLLRVWRDGGEPDEDDDVFDLTRQAVTAMVKRYTEAAGITKNTYAHIFRHTYIVQRIKEGVDLRTIQQEVGHARLQTTADYADMIGADRRKQLERGRLPW